MFTPNYLKIHNNRTFKVLIKLFNTNLRRVLPTSNENVWLSEDLEGYEINLQPIQPLKSQLFDGTARYISPKDLNFSLPINNAPEFAFIGFWLKLPSSTISPFSFIELLVFDQIGRSNVGKSSLVGSLLGAPSLVRTSRKPGCTRSVNYFGLYSSSDSSPLASPNSSSNSSLF